MIPLNQRLKCQPPQKLFLLTKGELFPYKTYNYSRPSNGHLNESFCHIGVIMILTQTYALSIVLVNIDATPKSFPKSSFVWTFHFDFLARFWVWFMATFADPEILRLIHSVSKTMTLSRQAPECVLKTYAVHKIFHGKNGHLPIPFKSLQAQSTNDIEKLASAF